MKPPLTSHTHPSIVSRNYVLPFVAICGSMLLNHTAFHDLTELMLICYTKRDAWSCVKGGHFDSYGLSNCRGGSNRTQVLHRDGQTDVAQTSTPRLQAWERVADRQVRVREVETSKEKSVSGASRELDNLSVPSVAHLLQKKFPATMQQAVKHYRWKPLVQSHFVLFYPCREGKSRTWGDRREYTNAIYGSEAAVV
jgi:hypothetical protein